MRDPNVADRSCAPAAPCGSAGGAVRDHYPDPDILAADIWPTKTSQARGRIVHPIPPARQVLASNAEKELWPRITTGLPGSNANLSLVLIRGNS